MPMPGVEVGSARRRLREKLKARGGGGPVVPVYDGSCLHCGEAGDADVSSSLKMSSDMASEFLRCSCVACASTCFNAPGMYAPVQLADVFTHLEAKLPESLPYLKTVLQGMVVDFAVKRAPGSDIEDGVGERVVYLRPATRPEREGGTFASVPFTAPGPCVHLTRTGCGLQCKSRPTGCNLICACEEKQLVSPKLRLGAFPEGVVPTHGTLAHVWATRFGIAVVLTFTRLVRTHFVPDFSLESWDSHLKMVGAAPGFEARREEFLKRSRAAALFYGGTLATYLQSQKFTSLNKAMRINLEGLKTIMQRYKLLAHPEDVGTVSEFFGRARDDGARGEDAGVGAGAGVGVVE